MGESEVDVALVVGQLLLALADQTLQMRQLGL